MNDPNPYKILRGIDAVTLIDFLKSIPTRKLKRFYYPKHSRVFRSKLYKSIAKHAKKSERIGMGEFTELVCFDLVMSLSGSKKIVEAIDAMYSHLGWKLVDVRTDSITVEGNIISNHRNNLALLTFSKVAPR